MGSKKNIILLSLFCFFFLEVSAQVGIGTTNPDASSVLDIESTNAGVLIPRIALDSIGDNITILSPATSLLVYNTSTISDVTPGFYFWNSSRWSRINDTDKVYGEIYNDPTLYSRPLRQNMNPIYPIRFEIADEIRGVTLVPLNPPSTTPLPPGFEGFQIITPGIYRVSYAISIDMKVPSGSDPVPEPDPVNVGFYLTTGLANPPFDNSDLLANAIPGSFSHSQITYLGNSSYSMSKIIHLDQNDVIRLFADSFEDNVYVMPNTASLNIELIKVD